MKVLDSILNLLKKLVGMKKEVLSKVDDIKKEAGEIKK